MRTPSHTLWTLTSRGVYNGKVNNEKYANNMIIWPLLNIIHWMASGWSWCFVAFFLSGVPLQQPEEHYKHTEQNIRTDRTPHSVLLYVMFVHNELIDSNPSKSSIVHSPRRLSWNGRTSPAPWQFFLCSVASWQMSRTQFFWKWKAVMLICTQLGYKLDSRLREFALRCQR